MGNAGEPAPEGAVPLPECLCSVADSDDFAFGPGLQWQWQCNPDPRWSEKRLPGLRLNAFPASTPFEAGQFLSQLMQRRDFDMDARFAFRLQPGDRCGIGVMGYTGHFAAVQQGKLLLLRDTAQDRGHRLAPSVTEEILCSVPVSGELSLTLRLRVRDGQGRFYILREGQTPVPFGEAFPLSQGGWTGARPGIFCLNTGDRPGGYADFEYVHFSRIS